MAMKIKQKVYMGSSMHDFNAGETEKDEHKTEGKKEREEEEDEEKD